MKFRKHDYPTVKLFQPLSKHISLREHFLGSIHVLTNYLALMTESVRFISETFKHNGHNMVVMRAPLGSLVVGECKSTVQLLISSNSYLQI